MLRLMNIFFFYYQIIEGPKLVIFVIELLKSYRVVREIFKKLTFSKLLTQSVYNTKKTTTCETKKII